MSKQTDQEQNQEQLTQRNSDASENIDTDEDDIFRDYDQEKIDGNFLKYFPNL